MDTMQYISVAKAMGATPTELVDIENALTKKDGGTATVEDRRTYNFKQCADIIGTSKSTVRRLLRSGRLAGVETMRGRIRITSRSVTDFVNGNRVDAPGLGEVANG